MKVENLKFKLQLQLFCSLCKYEWKIKLNFIFIKGINDDTGNIYKTVRLQVEKNGHKRRSWW